MSPLKSALAEGLVLICLGIMLTSCSCAFAQLFNAAIGAFRKRWMFYDLMSADGITGQYDNCLFSLHKPQKLGKTRPGENNALVKRLARFRVDGLPIEHAQYATGFTGPMAWLNAGKIDAVLDIQFPIHPDDEVDLSVIIEHLGKSMTELAKETGKELGLGLDDARNPFSGSGFAGWGGVGKTNDDRREWIDWGGLREDGPTQWSDGRWMGKDAQAIASTGPDARGSAVMAQNAIAASQAQADERGIIPGQHRLARPALRAPEVSSTPTSNNQDEKTSPEDAFKDREVVIDIDLRFRDLKASVPLYNNDLTIRNNAFIRPIVAFIK